MAEVTFDHYDGEDERRREALLSLGNGVLSWRASAPEALFSADRTAHYAGLYRAGWYDDALRQVNGRPTRIESLVNLPDPFGLSFSVDGQHWFGGQAQGYQQTVDLHSSVLRRTLRLQIGDCCCVLEEERFVSLADPTLAVLRWELSGEDLPDRLHVRAILDSTIGNDLIEREQAYEGKRLDIREWVHDRSGFAGVLARLPESGDEVAVLCQLVTQPAIGWTTWMKAGMTIQDATWLTDGASLVVEKRVRVLLGEQIPRPLASAAACMPEAAFAALRRAHEQCWRTLWEAADITVHDPSLASPLRLGMWHVLQSSPIAQGQYDQGFPSRGWQEGYFGQIFWDEMFVLPFLASRFARLSEQLLAYRHRHLETARRSARAAGYRGAMFPWRSARSGTEQTPPLRLNPLSGRWMEDPTYLQRHVGSAVAYDAWQHYQITGDAAWLSRVGAELMIEVARFWASIAVFDPSTGRYMIRGVIGPDEYHNGYPGHAQPGLDNNAYTNVMAAWVLFQARDLLDQLPDHSRIGLVQRLALGEEEPGGWTAIAERMYLPFVQDGILNQFDGYERLLASPAGWHPDRSPRLDWLLEARHDCTDRYQLSKQADVLTLLHLFPPIELRRLCERMGYGFDDAAMRRTAAFHLARITHESSLSKLVCAGALAHLDPEASWRYFCDCIRTDLDAPADSGTREGVHLAAMGGAIDVLQRHYLGLYPSADGLYLRPAVPPALDGVAMKVCIHGRSLTVELRARQLHLQLAADALPMDIVHHGQRLTLRPGIGQVIECRPTPAGSLA